MAEIASYGYFVVADGTPNGSGNRTQDRSMLRAMAAPLIAYIDWAIAEKPISPVDPMYIAGRLRTASRPSSTAMDDES